MPKWKDDADSSACDACRTKFTLLFRKHHCRLCGGIFCENCSGKKMAIASLQGQEDQSRVCDRCYAAETERRKEVIVSSSPQAHVAPTPPTEPLENEKKKKKKKTTPEALPPKGGLFSLLHQPLCLDLFAEGLVPPNPSRSSFIPDFCTNLPFVYSGKPEEQLRDAAVSLGIINRVKLTLKHMLGAVSSKGSPELQKACAPLSIAYEYTSLLGDSPVIEDGDANLVRAAAWHKALKYLTERLQQVSVGECAVVPIFYTKRLPSSMDSNDSGHTVFFNLFRDTVDTFQVGVVNLGDGASHYHPASIDGTSPTVGQYLRGMPLVPPMSAPRDAVISSWVWFFSLRQLSHPSSSNGPRYIYEVLLPALTRVHPRHEQSGPNTWAQDLPPGGDKSYGIAVLACIRYILACMGEKNPKKAEGAVRLAVLKHIWLERKYTTPSELCALRMGCETTARMGSVHGMDADVEKDLDRMVTELDGMRPHPVSAAAAAALMTPPATEGLATPEPSPKLCGHHNLNTLRTSLYDLNELAGKKKDPKILLPINTVDIVDVASPAEAVLTLKDAIDAIGLLAAQHQQIPNYAQLSIMLHQHIFTRVLPVPLADPSTTGCFWAPEEFRYETQMTLLRQLYSLSKSFAAVSLTLKADRELDGCRVIVSMAIMTLIDAVCRVEATDKVAIFSQHYNATLKVCRGSQVFAPLSPYGLYCNDVVKKTEDIVLFSPELSATRTQVLDYWYHKQNTIKPSHVIFKLENMKMTKSEDRFVSQLSLAFGRGDQLDVPAAQVLSGKNPWLTELCPEVVILRDVSFLTSMMTCYAADALPSPQPYRASDASLRWSADLGNRDLGELKEGQHDKMVVRGFGKDLAACKAPPPKEKQGAMGAIKNFFTGGSKRRDQSHACPAVLVKDSSVQDEEDVLYIHHLPTFNETLGAQACEQLLSFLTAPNLRIVLLLTFFASHDRIHCLEEEKLQAVVNAALFEPGPWRPTNEVAIPEVVPAEERDHLETPAGLLFDELCRSPVPVLKACHQLLNIAQEKCTGRYTGASAEVILFTIRLVCRVNRYLHHLVDALKAEESGEPFNEARGLQKYHLAVGVSRKLLKKHMKILDETLTGPCFIRLDEWVKQAEEARTVTAACKVHAHLALLFQNYGTTEFLEAEKDPERKSPTATVLSAQVYIATYHSWGEATLGVSEIEISDVFEKLRRPLYHALLADENTRNEALEAAKNSAAGSKSNKCKWAPSVAIPGAFLDSAMNTITEDAMEPLDGENYLQWLQRTASANDAMCININNGVFSHKKDDIGTTTDEIQLNTDFASFFGEGRMKCAVLSSHENRKTYRLLGTAEGTFDIHLWEPDERPASAGLELIGWDEGSARYTSGPDWAVARIDENIEKGSLGIFKRMDLRILESTSNYASFGGIHPDTGKGMNVVTIKSPPVTHIYQLTECGRRFYRRQVFTTDTVWSYHSPHLGEDVFSSSCGQRYFKEGNEWTLCAGHVDDDFSIAKSIQILRNKEDKKEIFLPTRLLLGVLPSALLEDYSFWQSLQDDDRYGTIRGEAKRSNNASSIEILLKDDALASLGAIRRTHTDLRGSEVTHRLMNLLDSRRGKKLAECFTRLENLSHILVWCTDDEKQAVKKVELPRLSLTFTVSKQKMYCDQLTGYYLYQDEFPEALDKLVSNFGGGCIVLTKESGDCAILTSAVAEPLRPDSSSLSADAALSWIHRRLPMQLLFRRSEPDMLECMTSDARHHMYPVHHSHKFLKSPTAPSMLYLMLCLALKRRYTDVAEMGCRLGEVKGDEEFGLLKRMVNALLDDKNSPDAVACRLKLSLSIAAHSASFVFEKVRRDWSPNEDIQRYMRRRACVSPSVALSIQEEAEALTSVRTNKTLQCRNREACLNALLRSRDVTSGVYAETDTDVAERNYYDNMSPKLSVVDWIGPSLSGIANAAMEEKQRKLTEVDAMMFIYKLQRDDLINIVLIYEIFKNTVSPKIVATDSNAVLGSVLSRLVCYSDSLTTFGLQFMRVLDRAAEMDPGIIDSLPNLPTSEEIEKELEKTRPKGVLGKLVANSATVEAKTANLRSEKLKEAVSKLKDEADKLYNLDDERYRRFIERRKVSDALKTAKDWKFHPYKVNKDITGLGKVEKWSSPPFISDVDVPKMPCGDIASFENPLKSAVWDGKVSFTQEAVDSDSLEAFKKILEASDSTAPVAEYKKTVDSVQNRADFREKTAVLEDMTPQKLTDLQNALRAVFDKDFDRIKELEDEVILIVNPPQSRLERIALIKPTYDMATVVRLYLSDECFPVVAGEEEKPQKHLRSLITEWLFTYSRLGQVKSTVIAMKPLISEVKNEGPDSITAQATMKAAMRLLTAKRHHVADEGGVHQFDPRMLAFEFMLSILLRKEQVKLIRKFMKARYTKRPMVHQMIMGQGKTTVIAPVLSVLIADGRNLVVLCMPKSLVNFSKSVLLDCFSSPILPRPIITLDFNRTMVITEHLYKRVVAAIECRAFIVVHPTAMKSLLLKYVLSFEKLDLDVRLVQDETAQQEAASYFMRVKDWIVGGGEMAGLGAQEKMIIRDELKYGGFLFEQLQSRSVMLMDEVDMLLHPLKSELNWPLGARHPLDMTQTNDLSDTYSTGVRSRLPWFLFELMFALSVPEDVTPRRHELSEHTNLTQHITALREAILEGVTSHSLSIIPHLTVISKDFYYQTLKPLLCRLVASWLQQYLIGYDRDKIRGFLETGKGDFRCSDIEAKTLNLAYDWLSIFFPHCLSKIHRVSFGVLRPAELDRARKLDPNMPKSRTLLAVPFVGKDTPSANSEFQHPDIAIGLTIHSTMQDGLRVRDLKELVLMLQNDFDKDESFPPQTRRAALTYVDWMRLEDACVKGYSWDGSYLFGKEDKAEPKTVDYPETKTETFLRRELWQLTVVNTRDEYQMQVVERFLKRSQKAIQYFLFHHAFPLTLIKAAQQLSAAGQELASAILSSTRLGFSGTPNDLLPQEMGECIYANHDDGEMIKTLIDPNTVTVTNIKSRDPKYIIKTIARGNTHAALIDTGALITGYSNREVAEKLFEYGLQYKGVVYLDADDRRMVHFGQSHRDLPIEQCGLAFHERFTFYDHIHTTGMDIKQPLECTAAITLSQDMVFRDFAQGAYRMRGIGIGQCIEILVPPEINTLISRTVKKSFKGCTTDSRAWDVLLWLLKQGARSEQTQADLLNKQNLNYLWRKRAFESLIDRDSKAMKRSLQLLREPVKCDLRNKIKPTHDPMPQRERDALRQLVAFNEQQFGNLDDEDKEKADAIITNSSRDEFIAEEKDLEEEQVNEEEAEASAEKESEREAHQEQEHEQEQEVQHEAYDVPEAAEDKPYVKKKIPVTRWPVSALQAPPGDENEDLPFSCLSTFVPIGKERTPMPFPSFLMSSANYVKEPGFFDRPLKRQKNVFMYLEWIPNPEETTLLEADIPLAPQQRDQLQTAFHLFCGSKNVLNISETRQLLKRMDLGLNESAVEEIYEKAAKGGDGISFEALEAGLSTMAMYKLLKGRYD